MAFLLSADNQNQDDKRLVLYSILALSVAYFVVTGWNLNAQYIISPDEPRYAVGAREMMRGGDLIVPVFNAHPHLMKPGFFYWLLTISGIVSEKLGVSLDTAGFRFVPLIMGWLNVVGVYLLARRLLNQRGAVIAAIVLLTSFQFHNTARELVIDMTLSAFLIWSWYFFNVAADRIQQGRHKFWPLLGFYLSLGFACMSKGPFLVAIFSTVPLLVYLVWSKKLSILANAGIPWGLPLSLAMGMSWSIALSMKGGDPAPFIAIENLARYAGMKDHVHLLPFFYYIISLPEVFAPWFVLLPFASWWTYKAFRKHGFQLDDGARQATCALGISFVIMGLSMSKRHLYLVPLLPLISLWIAWFIERAFIANTAAVSTRFLANSLRVLGVICCLGGISTIVWLSRLGGNAGEVTICVVMGLLLCYAFQTAVSCLKIGDKTGMIARVLAAALSLTFMMESVMRPIRERALNLSMFYSTIASHLDNRRLVIVGTNPNEASWYLGNPSGSIDEIKPAELKTRFFDCPNTALLVSDRVLRDNPELKKCVQPLSGIIVRNGVAFVLVEPDRKHEPTEAVLSSRFPTAHRSSIEDL